MPQIRQNEYALCHPLQLGMHYFAGDLTRDQLYSSIELYLSFFFRHIQVPEHKTFLIKANKLIMLPSWPPKNTVQQTCMLYVSHG